MPDTVTLASRLGLGRVPSPVTPSFWPEDRPRTPGPRVSGRYPAFSTTTNSSDSSPAIRLAFPARVMARPTSPGRSERPGHTWTTGHTHTSCPSSSPQNPEEPTRSPWITSLALSPHACRNHPSEPSPTRPFPLLGRGRATQAVPSTARSSASLSRGRSPPARGLAPVHYTFRPTASPPPPPHPPSPRRTGHQLQNFNGQSSGRTSTSSSTKLPGVHAARERRWALPAGGRRPAAALELHRLDL